MHAEPTVGLHLLGQYSRIPSFHGQAPSFFGATSPAWELASGVVIFAVVLSGEIVYCVLIKLAMLTDISPYGKLYGNVANYTELIPS